ncbi:serine hydrolase domain-containing protein [Gaetbulibacter sp. M240]|uniref:serine hydrolase domain-containing protein n=1 Tax=Gaetbulibacter sp. M240 TaxID=3126511 RepID=UPI00374F4AF3
MKSSFFLAMRCLLTLIVFITGSTLLIAQNIPTNLEKKIDSLFDGYNEKPSPGIAIGIMLNDEILLSKGYGLANLEHKIPISSSTSFNIASASKQFTAYAIAKLENEGKLSFEDDIRKYLPKLHAFEETITIDNLLFHTSGIRGVHILRGYIEGKIEVRKIISQSELLKIIYNQRELNFKPGTATMYSNSGYILLSEIVEKVFGITFADYLKQNIFAPLGMDNTVLVDSYEQIIPKRAEPYRKENNEYLRTEGMLWEDYGNSGIYSTIEDLFKWQRHIHKQTYMLRFDPNNNPSFAMGLMLNRDTDGELDEIFHFGSVPGYKTIVKYYPKINLDVITVSNLDNNRTDLMAIESIKNIFFDHKEDVASSEKIEVPLEYLRQFEGTYLIMGDNAIISIEGKNLMAQTPMGKITLQPIGPNEFLMEGTKNTMVFDKSLDFFTLKSPGGELKASRIEEDEPEPNYETSLDSFIGNYKSPELDILNSIELIRNVLEITTASNQKIQLNRTGEKTFDGVESYYYNKLVFEVENGKINAFRVTDELGWVQNLLFEKQ